MSKVIVAPIEVLTDSSLSDTERRVLLALYSFQGESESVWPSTETIAELIGISDVPRVSKVTKSLAEKGWLTKRKKGFTGCNSYTLTVPKSTEKGPSESEESSSESANLAELAKLVPDTNTNLAELAKYKEQTIEQTIVKTKKKSESQTFTSWMAQLRQTGEKPIPDDDPVFDYADGAMIPVDFVRLAWIEFKARYADQQKKYKDWRAVFRNSVRGNWGKIWWHDGNDYRLTTVGQQAMIALNNHRTSHETQH